ncbi:MAG TPA: hypothetical protein DCM08_12015 [Microscillaceae bacterium]|jgi:hypothetical protein|nr:hypothetical protein [Microscillaceae bacterium]
MLYDIDYRWALLWLGALGLIGWVFYKLAQEVKEDIFFKHYEKRLLAALMQAGAVMALLLMLLIIWFYFTQERL